MYILVLSYRLVLRYIIIYTPVLCFVKDVIISNNMEKVVIIVNVSVLPTCTLIGVIFVEEPWAK